MRNLRLSSLLLVCFFCFTAWAQKLTIAPDITVTVPSTWKATRDTKTSFLVEHAGKEKMADASMVIQVEKRRNHQEALRRLAEIEVEHQGEIKYVLIAGWPAVERKATVPFQYPGELPEQERERAKEPQGTDPQRMPHGRGGETSVRVTTVVAVADSVVRLQTLLQPDANPALADEALAMGRTLTGPPANKAQSEQDLRQLQQGTLKPKPKTIHSHE